MFVFLALLIIIIPFVVLWLVARTSKNKNMNLYFYGDYYLVHYSETKYGRDVYITDDNKQFMIMNNRIFGYLDTNIYDVDAPLEKESLDKIAYDYFKYITGTNYESYEYTKDFYQDTYKIYSYSFVKKINDIPTADSVTIEIRKDGTLYSISASRIGLFDKYNNLDVHMDDINKKVEQYIHENSNDNEYKILYVQLINGEKYDYFEVNLVIKRGDINYPLTLEFKIGEFI